MRLSRSGVVRCRLEGHFEDAVVTVEPPSTPPVVAWCAPVSPAAEPPRVEPSGEGGASPGGESLSSLRAQVALAARRCKAVNRLCVSELTQMPPLSHREASPLSPRFDTAPPRPSSGDAVAQYARTLGREAQLAPAAAVHRTAWD